MPIPRGQIHTAKTRPGKDWLVHRAGFCFAPFLLVIADGPTDGQGAPLIGLPPARGLSWQHKKGTSRRASGETVQNLALSRSSSRLAADKSATSEVQMKRKWRLNKDRQSFVKRTAICQSRTADTGGCGHGLL